MACSTPMLRSRPLSHLAGQHIAQPLLPARHRPTRAAPGWDSLPSTSSRSSRLTPGPLGGGLQRTGLRPQQPTGLPNGLRPQQPRTPPREQVVTRAKDAAAEDEDEVKKGWKFGRNEGNMPWPWKLCAAILYMLPWVDVTEKTVYFIERFPALVWTEFFTEPFEHWFYIHEWAPLIIFFGTYLGIVRNKKIPHVARYHIMMGVMLDIVAMILIVVEENLPFGVLWTPWSDLFYACMFWFVFLLVIYCLFFCFMGWYCEIPLISEGVYIQIEQAESMG